MRREHGAKERSRFTTMCRKVCFPARTACASSCGLDALIAWLMGVMSRLDATPKPPRSTAAHRHALRATNPFKTRVLACYFSSSQARCEITGNSALNGLVAPRYRLMAGDLAATVCGANAPQINRRVGASFCSLGRQNLFGSPRPARFTWGERSPVGSGDAN